MKKCFEKIVAFKLNKKALAVLLLLFMAFALIPVFRLAYYSAPYYDDYSYNRYVKSFYEAYGPKGIIQGMLFTVKEMWYAWQGTYSSIGFMSLTPLFLGEQYYFVGVWAVIVTITMSTFILAYTLVRNVLKADISESISVAVVFSLFLIEFIYTSYMGIFWYNSAAHYTLMHAFMFLMIAVSVKILYLRNSVLKVLFAIICTVLAVLSAGSNFVTCLQGFLFLLGIFVISLCAKKRKAFWLSPAIVAYAFGLYKNMTAPGNRVRGEQFEGQTSVNAILHSFESAFTNIKSVTSLASIIVLLVMLPTIIMIVHRMKYKFKLPGAVTVLAFCMYATGYTSSFYSMGSAPVLRTMVAVKFTYQLMLCVTVVYWIGWLDKRFGRHAIKLNSYLIYYIGLAALLITCFAFSKDKIGGYLSYGSYFYTHTNSAQSFYNEYMDRIYIIKNSREDVVKVPPITYRPWLLIGSSELSEDANAPQNAFMASYYGKEAIVLEKND